MSAPAMLPDEALWEAERAGEPVSHVRARLAAIRLDRIKRDWRQRVFGERP